MDMRKTAWVLSLSGFIPFGGLLVLAVLKSGDPSQAVLVFLLKTYAAIILSFLGGIRWGVALGAEDERSEKEIIFSVLSSLVGWAALLLPQQLCFFTLAAAFAAQGIWDRRSGLAGRLPGWFVPVRVTLSILVTTTLTLSAVLLN